MPQEQLASELKKLNEKLERIRNNDHFMVYNTNPWKFAFFNFIAGVFHSLGTLFGTLVVFGAIIYLFSSLNFTQTINSWIQQTMSQIKWEKVIPTPPPSISR